MNNLLTNRVKIATCLLLLVGLLMIIYFNGYIDIENRRTVSSKIQCIILNREKAIKIVKLLPEVKNYLSTGDRITNDQTSKAVINIDNESSSTFRVHVYSNEQYHNDPEIGHSTSFNWYIIDKCTAEIKCSFFEYNNSGKYVKNSDNYPCD